MSELPARYAVNPSATIGADRTVSANFCVFISPPEPNDLIAQYFEFTQVGVKLRPGISLNDIPKNVFEFAWDTCGANLDAIRWRIADLSIMHGDRFDQGDCVRAMAQAGLYRSVSTAQTWASWARNVPIEVRIPAVTEYGEKTRMSIYWHKHVAMLPVEIQRELLQQCLAAHWTEAEFERICIEWRQENPGLVNPRQQRRPVNRPARDVIFEITTDLGAIEVERDSLKIETSQFLTKWQRLGRDVLQLLAKFG